MASMRSVSLPGPAPASGSYRELALDRLDDDRVEAFWRYQASAAGSQLILPDGRMDLVAHCVLAHGSRVSAVWLAIAGPADRPRCLAVRPDVISVGIRFRIGWGGLCLGVDPASLRNRWLAGGRAAMLLGSSAQALLAARSLEELQCGLVRTVTHRTTALPAPPGHQRAIDAIRRACGAWQDTCGAPSRTLRRDVLAAAGLPLRSLAGILRFQRALSLLREGGPSLTGVAADAGYSDQSHMNREFCRFGGFTPTLRIPAPLVGDYR